MTAKNVLAIMLLQGVDMPADKAEAEKLLRYAAERGDTSAQNDLGFAIMHGDMSTRNLAESAFWCKMAQTHASDTNVANHAEANLGLVVSHLNMAQMLELNNRLGSFQPLPLETPEPLTPGWENNPAYQQEDGTGGH
jgi:TPR repeat protein